MFCDQGQSIIFYIFLCRIIGHRGLHLTCWPVQSINDKQSEHILQGQRSRGKQI